jgi:polyphosphate kinase
MPRRILKILIENFEVKDDIVMHSLDRLAFADWRSLLSLPMPTLKDAPFVPRTLWRPEHEAAVFDDIREQDRLLHHPYDSFSSVEAFIVAGGRRRRRRRDQDDLARIGQNSPLIDLLIEAAECGAQVAVLAELKARASTNATTSAGPIGSSRRASTSCTAWRI